MKDKIYIATFTENAIEVIRKYGVNMEFNHLCISDNLNEEVRENTICQMKNDFNKSKSKKAIIHGPFTEIVPASIDSRAVSLGLERLEEAYSVCERLNVQNMVVHTGYIPKIYFKEWHLEKSVVFWKEFMKDKPKEFKLYIENVFEDEPYMMKSLIENIKDDRVKICLDIGHANCMTDNQYSIYHWIDILGKDISHIHLHNNYGKKDEHKSIDDGNINMIEFIPFMFKNINKDVTLTIESRKSDKSMAYLMEEILNV